MTVTTGIRLKSSVLVLALTVLAACQTDHPVDAVPRPEPGAANVADVRAYGDALLQQAHASWPRSGFSAAIVSREAVIWSGSVGTLTGTGAEALPVTADLPMHIGSITKLFTALAIMQLIEQGKLDLDASLRTYIPEFRIHSRFGNSDFTLRQMLTHYSGLPSDLLEDFSSTSAATRDLFASTVERTAQTHLKSRPDFAHSYSNLAYTLLGIVIERVSGKPYDAYIQQHIFAPLQMQHAAVLVPDAAGKWPLEYASTDPRQFGYEPVAGLSAAGVVASLDDMMRFAQMLLAQGAGVVSPESFAEMQRVQDGHVTLGGGRQGLAFQLAFPPGEAQFSAGHSGALPGHSAWLRVYPDQDLAVVVLETHDDDSANSEWLGGNLRDVALEFVQPGSSQRPQADPADLEAVSQSANDAKRYEGLYFAFELGLADVVNDDGTLRLHLASSRFVDAHLLAAGDHTFIPRLRFLGLIPVPASFAGLDDATRLRFDFDGDRRYISLVSDAAPPQPLAASVHSGAITAQWRRRRGIYQPDEPPDGVGLLAKVRLYVDAEHGIAMADARTTQGQQLGLALELLSDSEAAIAGVGRYTGEVIEFVSEDEFVFEGTHFKRI